ncbi:MAG: IPT/TIG domain-containing protein, partial [Thermoanaerobaculia bacterium]
MILLAFAGCEGESPTEPPRGGGSGGGTTPPPTDASIALTVSNPAPLVGSTTTITANVTQGGQPVPNGTAVEFSTTLGTFVEANSNTTIRTTTDGKAAVVLTSNAAGTAVVTVRVNNASAVAQIVFQTQSTEPPPPDTAPAITAISPSKGKPAGGDLVIISGRNFTAPVRVLFGDEPATVVSQSENEIRVVSPAIQLGLEEQAREVTITVFTQFGTAGEQQATGGPFRYELTILTPRIFHVSPSSGPNEGNTRVTIFGEGFQSPAKVFFGTGGSAGASLTDQVEAAVQQVSFGQIIVLTPPASGLGAELANEQVTVRVLNVASNTDAVQNQAFRYGPLMRITAVGPTQGLATGSTRVTIDGWGFDDPVAVTVGGIAAQVISVTGTKIIVQTGLPFIQSCADVTGPVAVTNIEDGTSATAEGLTFTYIMPQPVIVGITPNPAQPGQGIVVSVSNAGNGPARFQIGSTGVLAGVPSVSGGIWTYPLVVPSNIQFDTEACTELGAEGERFIPTSLTVAFENVTTGCTDTLNDGLTVNPFDATCRIPPAQATAEPGALTFEDVTAGTSTSSSVTVSNTGGAPLTVTSINEQVDSSGYFTVNPGNCAAAVLATGDSCLFSITYAPAVAGGPHTATYQVVTDANDPVVSASGTSV